jgi:ParE toxin of type II toxin-antitoxin system, parDE
MIFILKIDEDAPQDIQEITDWYNIQLKGLGTRFQIQVISQINSLKSNPHTCSIKYDDMRCILIKKFPFLVHYSIDETNLIVSIYGVLHTSRNPQIWKIKKK